MGKYLGNSLPRIDAEGKVRGHTLYPGDINLPEQAYMKILFASRPHAKIIRVDTTQAEALKGVLGIFTAKDVPVNEYGLIIPDQPVLCGPGSSKENADRVRFIGDQIAIVVAETEEIASIGRDLIKVEFEDLPIVSDMMVALNATKDYIHPEKGTNVIGSFKIRKGDVDKAFATADVIVEGEYKTPVQEHAYLQPEAGIGYIDSEGRVTIVVAGQWTHEDQEQIAHSLGIPLEQVRVIYPAIGGAFGGREDMSVQIVLALAVWKLSQKGINRPIKIIWSREESIIGHHKRHPYIIKSRWGATRDGKVIAAETQVISDGGAYAYTSTKVLANATLMCTGPYDIPNVKVDACSVYTNNIPNGAFRGFGGPQGAFAAESQMNRLAELLKIDPVEIRTRNLLKEGSLLPVSTPVPTGVSIHEVVEKCAGAFGWKKTKSGWSRPKGFSFENPAQPYLKRGIGFACSYKNIGFSFGAPENCSATVELHGDSEIEHVVLHHAGADVGQGAHSAFVQMAAEALDIPTSKIELIASDTAFTHSSGSASASRLTFMAGNSIKGAAQQALEKWGNEERPAIATYIYRPPKTTPYDPETGKCEPNFAYGYVAEALEVEVDIQTGEARIVTIVCVDDVGKITNLQQLEGQTEGALVQALGYTMMENFIQKEGQPLTRKFSTYLIPTVLDIPDEIQSVFIESVDPVGPWGVKGMGEMPFLPLAPAVTAAIKNATGKWFTEFPLVPEKILSGIEKK